MLSQQRGYTLLEQIIALAIASITFALLLNVLAGIFTGTERLGDRTTLFHLAQQQMESIKQQTFRADPSSYALLSSVPEGYTIAITGTTAVSYQYPSPDVIAAAVTAQAITVTVADFRDQVFFVGYKVRR